MMKSTNNLIIGCFSALCLGNIFLMILISDQRFEYMQNNSLLEVDDALVLQLVNTLHRTATLLAFVYPIYLVIKVALITCIINTGFAINQVNLPFKKLLFLVILAEFVYLIPSMIELIKPTNHLNNPYLPYLHYSIYQLFTTPDLPFFIKYLSNAFNIFEAFYYLVLVIGLSYYQELSFRISSSGLLQSYFVCYLFWSAGVGVVIEKFYL